MAISFNLSNLDSGVSGKKIMRNRIFSQTTFVTTTVSGSTKIQVTDIAGGSVLEWVTDPLDAFTFSGSISYSMGGRESGNPVNATWGAQSWKLDKSGNETEIIAYVASSIEMSANQSGSNTLSFSGTGFTTDFANGDRVLTRVYVANIGTMGNGTATLGTAFSTGTSRVTLSSVTPRVSGTKRAIIPSAG